MALRLFNTIWLTAATFATPSLAETWREDVWHFVCQDSPFFTPDRLDRHSAGVLTSEGGFALMVLGDIDQGALVSINIPGETIQPEVTSTLEMPAGTVFSRTVSGDQLWAVLTIDRLSVTYTFRVDPADIEFFQAGKQWRVTAGEAVSTVPLKGSRKAINAAIQARDRPTALAPNERPLQLVR